MEGVVRVEQTNRQTEGQAETETECVCVCVWFRDGCTGGGGVS